MLNLLKKLVRDAKEMGMVITAIPVGNEFIVLGRPVDVLNSDSRILVAEELALYYRRSVAEGYGANLDRCYILSDSILTMGDDHPMSGVVTITLVFVRGASSFDALGGAVTEKVFHVDPSRCIVVE